MEITAASVIGSKYRHFRTKVIIFLLLRVRRRKADWVCVKFKRTIFRAKDVRKMAPLKAVAYGRLLAADSELEPAADCERQTRVADGADVLLAE